MNFNRNNLDKEYSPYLIQHKNNPVYWQTWIPEVLNFAKTNNKLVLLSIGYATCHWCHEMSKDTFSDLETANFINDNFIPIKVDKEQRPDIDSYYMDFVNQILGRGGWPLNIVLTPDLKPIFAGTFFPSRGDFNIPKFKDVLEQVLIWYYGNKLKVTDFYPYINRKEIVIDDERTVLDPIKELFDSEYGGFGQQTKYLPYNTLLFLMAYADSNPTNEIEGIINKTLNEMMKKGIHDHLQGGFFRYTIDRGWALPHFEKMLYDQAMMLWVYSWAYKIFKIKKYKKVIKKTIDFLDETFNGGDLFFAALDSDTNGHQGSYYLWSIKEIEEILTPQESKIFFDIYELYSTATFDNKNHLVKRKIKDIKVIEKKLLKHRSEREKPFVNKKFLTDWNSLLAIGFIMAYRYAGVKSAYKKSFKIYSSILKKHFIGDRLCHSSIEDQVQKEVFISDYAAFLLLSTYIYEEERNNSELIEKLLRKLEEYWYNGSWYKNIFTNNFVTIPAETFDYPTPSDVSIAEMARLRAKIILKEPYELDSFYKLPLQNDFYNLFAYYKNGHLHQISTPTKIEWNQLPLNTIQFQNDLLLDCYDYGCMSFREVEDLIDYLRKPYSI